MKREVKKLIDTCIKINDTTKHDAFFSVEAHVRELSIRVYEGGWKRDHEEQQETDFNTSIYYAGALYDSERIIRTQTYLTNLLGIKMKRFKLWEQVQNKLEAMDDSMQNNIDDAWDNFQKTIDKNEKKEISNYLDKLREQRKELDAAIKHNRSKLCFKDSGGSKIAEMYGGSLMLPYKVVEGEELIILAKFLQLMMEEV